MCRELPFRPTCIPTSFLAVPLSGCPVAANGFKEDAEFKPATQAEGIPDGWMGLDIGARSSARFSAKDVLHTFVGHPAMLRRCIDHIFDGIDETRRSDVYIGW